MQGKLGNGIGNLHNFSRCQKSKKNLRKNLTIFFSISVLFLFTFFQLSYGAGINFDPVVNVSDNFGFSFLPEIASVSSNVYIVWQDDDSGDTDIFFKRSTDDGATFDAVETNLSFSDGFSDLPQIAASGSNVFVTWQDDPSPDFINDIFFTASTDNGGTFGATTNLSTDLFGDFSENPKIASVGDNVYVVWQTDVAGEQDVYFVGSNDAGTTFDVINNLSSTPDGFSEFPEIAATGSNVYVVWVDDDNPPDFEVEVFFAASTNSGASFTGSKIISDDDSFLSAEPKIAAVGNNVYIVWEDYSSGIGEIFFAVSTDNGVNFSTPINLSNNAGQSQFPVIAANGNQVYIAWEDDSSGDADIFFAVSNDSGATFSTPTNLSSTFGVSIFPQIEATGTSVFVTWEDDETGFVDILLKASMDNGATFGTTVNLSDNFDDSINSRIALSGLNCHVAWEDDPFGDVEIFYRHCLQVPTLITFDSSQYKLSDTATLTVDDAAFNTDSGVSEQIVVTVTSDSDPLGLSVTLTETGDDTGIFEATIDFTSDPSSGTTLMASPGDTISALFAGNIGTAQIFPALVSFDAPDYTLGNSAKITVTNQNANIDTNSIESVEVMIISTTDPVGISLTLFETGVDTGMFENQDLIFLEGNDQYTLESTIKIIEEETGAGQDTNGIIDNLSVDVTSTSDPVGITYVLTEVNENSGIFEESLLLTAGATSANAFHVEEGDILTVTYNGIPRNALIIPNPNLDVGAIQAAIGDDITVSYLLANDVAPIIDDGAPGGGGGGVKPPSLVLDFVAGTFSLLSSGTTGGGGGGPDSSPPSVSSSNAIIRGNPGGGGIGGIISQSTLDDSITDVIATGETLTLRFEVLESTGVDNISHVTLYLNGKGKSNLLDGKTYVRYNKYSGLEIKDIDGILSNVDVDIVSNGRNSGLIFVNLEFEKPMKLSDTLLRMWDLQRNQQDILYINALEVVESGYIISDRQTTKTNEENINESDIPLENKIPEIEVDQEPLVSPAILQGWAGYSPESVSDSQLLSHVGVKGEEIPNWFKKSKIGKWAMDEAISHEELVNALKFFEKIGLT